MPPGTWEHGCRAAAHVTLPLAPRCGQAIFPFAARDHRLLKHERRRSRKASRRRAAQCFAAYLLPGLPAGTLPCFWAGTACLSMFSRSVRIFCGSRPVEGEGVGVWVGVFMGSTLSPAPRRCRSNPAKSSAKNPRPALACTMATAQSTRLHRPHSPPMRDFTLSKSRFPAPQARRPASQMVTSRTIWTHYFSRRNTPGAATARAHCDAWPAPASPRSRMGTPPHGTENFLNIFTKRPLAKNKVFCYRAAHGHSCCSAQKPPRTHGHRGCPHACGRPRPQDHRPSR